MSNNVVIAGGGTGGHIYPALSIAQAIKTLDPQVSIHFVGSPAGLEGKIIPPTGFPLHLISIGKLNFDGSPLKKLMTLLRLPFGLLKAAMLVIQLRPKYVLGVGGYASGPFLLVATLLGKKTALWEPNAHPGMTNRWLSYFVKKAFVVFDEAKTYLKSPKIFKVGIPVRAEIEGSAELRVSKSHEKIHVLVFGGSQGARAINQAVQKMIVDGGTWLEDFIFVHQTGSYDFANVKAAYEGHTVSVLEYLNDMPSRYRWADIVISRSGASTVAELAAQKKVAIMIPLPSAADNHQQKNAEVLVKSDAGVMILQKDLTPENLKETLLKLKNNPELRLKMSTNVGAFHQSQAATELAKMILQDLTPS